MVLSHNKVGDDDIDVIIQHDIETIKQLPSEHTEQNSGEWIKIHAEGEELKVKCSECGYMVNYFWNDCENANYCPNCGNAKISKTGDKNDGMGS